MEYLLTLLILSMVIVSFGIELNVVYEWKYCEYEWKSQEQKEDAINSGAYNPYKCLFASANKAKDGRVFVTTPNIIERGSPATLMTVTNKTGPGGPLIRPYPNWKWHNSNCMCDGIVNVYYTKIRCNHIFVLDSGQIGSEQVCNPKLLIFNLENDTLVETIYIPLDIATNQTGSGLLVSPLIYVPDECTDFLDKMIIFISDTGGSGLVVYDSSTKRMCRVESDYMKPTDIYFFLAGQNITYTGGIWSMTIIHDDLYYSVISAKEMYKIKVKALLKCPNKERVNKQTELVTKLSSQLLEVASVKHYIFYTDTRANSILGMNVYKKPDKNAVVLAQDDEKLQVVSSTKTSNYWNQLTGLSNRYQHYALNTYNLDEINFRYFEMDLTEILKKMDKHY